ncbi:MAG: hypothetical protein WBM08_03605 [Prochlorococcaceae cyanobacterium]
MPDLNRETLFGQPSRWGERPWPEGYGGPPPDFLKLAAGTLRMPFRTLQSVGSMFRGKQQP